MAAVLPATRSRIRSLLAVASIALVLTSCASTRRQYRDLEVRGLPVDIVWRICLDTVQTEFRLDPAQVDVGRRTLTTRWRNELRAFGMGRRRRAIVELETIEPEAYRVRYYVELQRYGEMATPLEPKEEEWDAAGQDGAVELRLYRHLTLRVDQALGAKPRSPGRVDMENPMRRR